MAWNMDFSRAKVAYAALLRVVLDMEIVATAEGHCVGVGPDNRERVRVAAPGAVANAAGSF
jgi:hypothetical protein